MTIQDVDDLGLMLLIAVRCGIPLKTSKNLREELWLTTFQSAHRNQIYLAFNLMHFVKKNVVQIKCDVVYTKKKFFMYEK